MKKLLIIVLGLILVTASVQGADRFERAKEDFAKAGCVSLEFWSILQSDIFDLVDTTRGTAVIGNDGRFAVTIGTEEYVFDGDTLFSYSQETDQVIVEETGDNPLTGTEIAFITRIDDFFVTTTVEENKEYLLHRLDSAPPDLPAEVRVMLDADSGSISRFRYLDINGDVNVIVLRAQDLSDHCPDDSFVPAFPESAERVKL